MAFEIYRVLQMIFEIFSSFSVGFWDFSGFQFAFAIFRVLQSGFEIFSGFSVGFWDLSGFQFAFGIVQLFQLVSDIFSSFSVGFCDFSGCYLAFAIFQVFRLAGLCDTASVHSFFDSGSAGGLNSYPTQSIPFLQTHRLKKFCC